EPARREGGTRANARGDAGCTVGADGAARDEVHIIRAVQMDEAILPADGATCAPVDGDGAEHISGAGDLPVLIGEELHGRRGVVSGAAPVPALERAAVLNRAAREAVSGHGDVGPRTFEHAAAVVSGAAHRVGR